MDWLKSKWAILTLAVFVGLVSIFPYYLAQFSLGSDYQGMPLLIQDSEGEYLGRVHELIEGNYSIASAVFYEYKDWPSLVPPTGEWIYAIPNFLFGISIINVGMIYKFLFPTLLFLLAYVFLKDLTKSKFWSIVGAFVVTLGFDLPSFDFLRKLLLGNFSGYISPWTRPVNPITGMLFLAGYMTLIYRIFTKENIQQNRNHYLYYIFTGIILSLMVGYVFSFIYAGILTVLLLIYSLFKDKSVSWRLTGVLIVGALGVLLLLGPSILSLLSGDVIGGMNDPRLQGLFYTRLPLLNKTSLLFTFIFLAFTWFVYFYKKEKLWLQNWWIFSFVLLIVNQIVFNIQIVLGWTIWPQHFAQYTNVSLSLVLAIFLARAVSPFFPKLARLAGWILVALLVLLMVKTLPNNKDTLPILRDFQKEKPVMDFLNTHNPDGCVAFVVQDNTIALELNRFIPAYTNCDVYNSYHIYQGVPRDRVFHNMLAWLWMKGVTEKELPEFLDKENVWIRAYLFRDWRDMFCCDGDPWIAKLGAVEEWQNWYKDTKMKVTTSYADFLKQDIHTQLGKYRLDYVIIDKTSRVRGDMGSYKWLKEVYSGDRYVIYSAVK